MSTTKHARGFKFGGGCCCCNDLYHLAVSRPRIARFYNDLPQMRIEARSNRIDNDSTTRWQLPCTDRRNMLYFGCHSSNALPDAGKIRYCPLDWDEPKTEVATAVGLLSSRANIPEAMGVDGHNRRIFYVSRESESSGTGENGSLGTPSDQATFQIRRVNYDGTSDTQLVTETADHDEEPTATGTIASLLYDPGTDRLYYVFRYYKYNSGYRPQYVIKYINATNPSGATTVRSYLNATTSSANDRTVGSLTMSLNRGLLFWDLKLGVSSPTYELTSANLDGGSESSIVSFASTFAILGTFCAYSQKQDRLYYMRTMAGTNTARNRQLRSCLYDGTDDQIFLDGPTWQDYESLFPSAYFIGLSFKFGCGFESKGNDYNGPYGSNH